MPYKTIVLEFLEQTPALYDPLRSSGCLLSTMNQLATQLREMHIERLDQLQRQRPAEDRTQLSSEALELAIHELLQALSPHDKESFSLDEAMHYLQQRQPHA